jgi:hypothetical protein
MTTRKIRLFDWTCQNGHTYRRPHLGDFSHGAFLVERADGTYAVADSFRGPAWEEVETLLRELPAYQGLDIADQGTLAQFVYARTIDQEAGGSLRLNPTDCPICGAGFRSIADIDPPVWVDDVPFATHGMWAAMSPREKRTAVGRAASEVRLSGDIGQH